MEAFARSFLLAAIRLKGDRGADAHGLAEWYADGLRAGTDPSSPEAWPRPDVLDQAKVEACSIALALHWSRPWLWDRLRDTDREHIVNWLGTVVGESYPPINWVWFQIVVETFLWSGEPHRRLPDDELRSDEHSLRRASTPSLQTPDQHAPSRGAGAPPSPGRAAADRTVGRWARSSSPLDERI